MSPFLRIFSYLARYPWLATGTIFSAIMSTAMVAVFPAITERIIDNVLRQGEAHLFLPLIFLGLGAFFLQDGLNSLRIFLNNHFEQRVIFDLRSDLYRHIQFLPLSWFDQHTTGDIMTRLMEDVTAVERALIDGIEQGSVALLQILIITGLMLHYSPSLTAAALLPLPFLIMGSLLFVFKAHSRFQNERTAASTLNAILHDNLDGIRQIKTYTSEARELRRFNEASNNVRCAMLRLMKAWALYKPSMTFLSSLGMLLILAYGTHQVLEHRM